MRLSLKTPPVSTALDWATEVKGHLRIDSDDEAGRIQSVCIPAAEQWAESATGRQLITATWQLFLDRFPSDSGCPIYLPKPPLQSVTSVKYYDGGGVQQTWAASNYTVTAPAGPKAGPGFILPKVNAYYPDVYGSPYEIEIEFKAGYGDTPANVPGLLKSGMLILVAELFEHREQGIVGNIVNEVPLGARDCILPFQWEQP